MSQTNIADGYPLIYENYTIEKKKILAKKRQDRMILSSINNAIKVGAGAFLSYAGLALPFIKDCEYYIEEKSPIYCKSIHYVKTLLKENNLNSDIVLDMIPGDSYNFDVVEKLFGKQYYSHESIRESSIEFFNKYNWIELCDTFGDNDVELSINKKMELSDLFIDNYKQFVINKFKKTESYQDDVFNINFIIKDSQIEKKCELSDNPSANVIFTFSDIILEKLLIAKINWENTYIGYGSKVQVDSDYNIGSLIRWLSMYGYIYQQRIFPNAAR